MLTGTSGRSIPAIVGLSKSVLLVCLFGMQVVRAAPPPNPIAETVEELRARAQSAARNVRLGDTLFRKDDVKKACRAYAAALDARPSWWIARLAVVRCGRYVGIPIETLIEHARFAVRARPQIPATHLQYGLVLEEAGRFEPAIAAYEQALRSHVHLATARFRLGVLQARAGRLQSARQNLEEVLNLRPDYMVARVHLTDVYEKLGLIREAESRLEELVELSRYPARALSRLIRFYTRHKMYRQAKKAKRQYQRRFEN
jgi:tetratricopeptide (TPR) repeat protein